MDKNGTVIGKGELTTAVASGTAINLKVSTSAMKGNTVTFQAFARDAAKNNIAVEVAPFKTAVAK